ncbi:MAG: cupin domain-containing protein [Candidatus Bathyarchaeia archaeon]
MKVVRLEDAELRRVLGGPIKVIFTPETAGTKNLRFAVGYFGPGEGLNPHLHPESEEVYYVIRGRGRVYIGEGQREIPIEPEMALYIPPGTVHRVVNTGKERLLVAFFVSPGKEPSKEVKA